jgi:anti-sigma factor RsiW
MKMNDAIGDVHERARRLLDAERVEGLAAEESNWLANHLAACEDCARRAASTEAVVRGLRSVSVALPPGLAESAKLRVHAKFEELNQRRSRNAALIAGCAVSWAAGVASAPLIWRIFAWLGAALNLPRIVWEIGFVGWWFVPAAAAGLVILWARARAERQELSRVADWKS